MISSLISLYIAAIMSTTETPEPPLLPNFGLASVIDSYAAPVKSSQFISPIIEAKSAIAIDVESGAVLFEKNAHERRAIASITKLMTMTIILEENELTETATVSANAAAIEGSTMYLRPGENITVENLLYGAIINSANDAAVALAEHNAGTVSEFVEKMNKKALSLGLVNTHFSNPIGLDHPDNYSSAYDIAKLSRYIYQYEFIRQAAQLKDFEVSSIDEKYKHKLNSTNDLLDSYLHIKGLKTGRTDTAGLCMVAVAEKNENNEIITVVLNSPARFTETKILVDWVFRAYSW